MTRPVVQVSKARSSTPTNETPRVDIISLPCPPWEMTRAKPKVIKPKSSRDTIEAVKRLMADGKERTIDDIRNRIGASDHAINEALTNLSHAGFLKRGFIPDGKRSFPTWRAK